MSSTRNAVERVHALKRQGMNYEQITEQLATDGFTKQDGGNYSLQTVRSYGGGKYNNIEKRKYTKKQKPGPKPGKNKNQMQTIVQPDITGKPLAVVIGSQKNITEFIQQLWG